MPRVSDGESGFQEILRKCGTRLALTCPHCNSEYLPGEEFCGEGGHKEVTEGHKRVRKGSLRGSPLRLLCFITVRTEARDEESFVDPIL